MTDLKQQVRGGLPSANFTLHLSGENYAYVMTTVDEDTETRNGAINRIIAEHRAAAEKRAARKAKV